MKKILVVGDINVDLICHGCQSFPAFGKEILIDDFAMALGGSSAICAMGLARLGTATVFIGKIGADPWGDYCLSALRDAGVDTRKILRDATLRTGASVSISSNRDRALISFPGSVDALCADDIGDEALRDCAHLHVASYFLQSGLRRGCGDLFRRARAAGLTTSLDPGCDPRGRWGEELIGLLDLVDVFLPNEDELAAISGANTPLAGLQRLRNGHTRTVVTLAERGCATLEGDRWLQVPAPPVGVIDSTGAGDSFDAGFLHAWLRGMPIRDCLLWGAACGSLSARGLGGVARQADAQEVSSLLHAHA